MYICMYVYIYIYIHTYIHTYMYICFLLVGGLGVLLTEMPMPRIARQGTVCPISIR